MRYVLGLIVAAGLFLAVAPEAKAQLTISVGGPYGTYVGVGPYANPYYGGYGAGYYGYPAPLGYGYGTTYYSSAYRGYVAPGTSYFSTGYGYAPYVGAYPYGYRSYGYRSYGYRPMYGYRYPY